MSKKRIIVIVATGLISFAGAFAFAWFTATKTVSASQRRELNETAPAASDFIGKPKLPGTGAMSVVGVVDSEAKKSMTEKQLKSLVYEVREKAKEYDSKLQGIEARKQRLQITHNLIKKDIEELDNLRIELASIVAGLKSERDKLLKSRVEIAKAEKANLISMAATYDKMEASSASKILTNMSKMQKGESGESNLDDAVKILHYMTERTKAKLLAELVTSEPKLAAVLCRRLKQIVEEE